MSDPVLSTSLEAHLRALPVLPSVVATLMTLDRSSEDYADRVLGLISAEPNFSARVIAAANSASSSPVSRITTLGGAVGRIGSNGATNLVLALGITRVFVPRDDWERSLWRHALHVALASRALVAQTQPEGISPDEAYTVGLLHDIGRFVLFQEAPDQLREVDEGAWDSPAALIECEQRICGINHAELGALACRRWSIPDEIADIIEAHHDPSKASDDGTRRLAEIVRVADLAMFPSAMAWEEGYASADVYTVDADLCPLLPTDVAMEARALRRLIIGVTQEADATLELIGLGRRPSSESQPKISL